MEIRAPEPEAEESRPRRQVSFINERNVPSVKANHGGNLFAFLKKGGTVSKRRPFNVPRQPAGDVEGAFL